MEGEVKQNGTSESNSLTNHVNHVTDNGVSKSMGSPKSNHHSSSGSKHHSSSSSSKDPSKHRSSSSHHSSSSGHKHHSSSSSKHGSSSSSKHGSSSSHKPSSHHSSSSSHKSKDGHHSSSKHHSSSSSKHRDSSSSSSHRHKDGSSSHHSSSKHSSSSSKPHGSSSSSKPHSSSSGSASKSHSSSSDKKHRTSSEHGVAKVKAEPGLSPTKSAPQLTPVKNEVKKEMESDDDIPLNARSSNEVHRAATKRPALEDSDGDDVPLSVRKDNVKKIKAEEPIKKEKRKADMDDDFEPKKKKKKEGKDKKPSKVKKEENIPGRRKKGVKEEPAEKWKWWEEERKDDGTKWTFLEHKGPVFAPDYEPLPEHVRFYYDGKQMHLSPEAEEVATFYGRMLDHDYTTKEVFNKNFFKDWRKVMNESEKKKLADLSKCNFKEMLVHFKEESERKKNRTKEEKQALKKQNEDIVTEYGFCIMDGHKEKIGNFRIEPPGLFRGRGDHPKQGMLKTRTQPEDVIINCSRDSQAPQPPKGHKWKEVRHDNTVSWLASWSENIQGSTKYVMLNAASRLKGEKDWMKYETARRLHRCADKIRAQYRQDWKAKEMKVRQRAVAMYFIDKLALRAGNEKDEESADTVGCCSLRVEHLKLHEKMGDKEFVVEFDFLGKDSIRYQNSVAVEKRVFKNLQLFTDNKSGDDDLFDRLNTAILNKHLQGLMDGLTAKVFRTYNASKTLQEQLNLLTAEEDPVAAKLLSYNRSNRAVAVLCNHQRAAPKNFTKQMENLQIKIDAKKDAIKKAKKELKACKVDFKSNKSEHAKKVMEKKKKTVERLEEQLVKLEVQLTDKDENKEIALGTSKLNYLDPRISISWCKKWEVPIEKIYNKTQREKFAWAIEMVDEDFEF